MPISVYRCDCGKERFERLVPMSANSATASCPSCGAADARKHMSTFAAPRGGVDRYWPVLCSHRWLKHAPM